MTQIDSAILQFLVNACWQICLIAAAAALADRMLQRAPARFRFLLWATVLCLCIIVPLLPHGTLPAVTNKTPTFRFVVDASGALTNQNVRTAASWLTVAYGLFLIVAALRLVVGLRRVNDWLRDSEPLSQQVRLSSLVPAPMTFGMRIPVILIPRSFAAAASKSTLDAVLAHERAHIARNDFAWNLFLLLIALPVCFHPAVRYAQRRLAAMRELACDEQASTGTPSYAKRLLEAATVLTQPRTQQVALGLFDCNSLEERIMKLFDNRPQISARMARARVTAICLTIAAASIWVSTNNIAFAQKVERVGKDVSAPKLIYKVEPSYEESAKKEKIAGPVKLHLIVTSKGEPRDVEVIESLDPRLDLKAIEAVKQWRFEPGKKSGVAVDVEAKIEVNFRLL